MVDRLSLVSFLTRLNPADLGTLLAAIDGAADHVSRQGTVAEQAAELIRWAESSTGPSLEDVEKAAREILRYTRALEPEPVGQLWTVPYPRNAFFQGRGDVIESLRTQLTKQRKAAVGQAITGLGGIGKTQTAVEYAYRYRDEYRYVLWINAESPLSLKTGAAEHAARLQLRFPENDLDGAEQAFRRWLGTEPGWLLILDNADDPSVLPLFLPESGNGQILITSRAKDFQDLGIVAPTGLDELSVEDATSFLLHRCRREDADPAERAAASDLARELDGLPLALEQAAAFIVERSATFQTYLQSYRSRGLKLFEARLPALGKYKNSVTRTWAANFEAVQNESPGGADVLRLSAYLAPDSIPFELLTDGASQISPEVEASLFRADHDPIAVNELLHPLARFSLIRIDSDKQTYSIHRMVQEVLKSAMDDDMRRVLTEKTLRVIDRAFPDVEYENWSLCGQLLPHAIAIISSYDQNIKKVPEVGSILHRMASYLYERGQYAKAEPHYLQAMEIRRASFGEGNPHYATTLNSLALLYQAMGRFTEAESLFLRAMEIRRDTPGEGHPQYATTLNSLALLFKSMGRYAEAEPLCKQAMEIRRVALGEGHRHYANSLNNLALLYQAMKRYGAAEPLFLRAMEIRRKVLGEGHPRYANSLNNLAWLYQAMKRYAEAEPLCKQAVELRRKALGDVHPQYATSLNNLAMLYKAMDRHVEAEPLFLQAMEIRRKALGEGHPRYANSLKNLAGLYQEMGRHAEAEPLLKELEELRQQAQGGSDDDRLS